MSRISSGEFKLLIASPPCRTFSRARSAGKGPPPLRSSVFQRGFPWLSGKLQAQCETGNVLVQRALQGIFILEHPEHLGKTAAGLTPGSMWSWPETVTLAASSSASSFAVFQCSLGGSSSKPTRFLSNASEASKQEFVGWPRFSEAEAYLGPLPRSCGHSHTPLRGPAATAAAAAYPAELNAFLARLLISSLKEGSEGSQQLSTHPRSLTTSLSSSPLARRRLPRQHRGGGEG